MRSYAILLNPGHNRIYFETSVELSSVEFTVAAGNLPVDKDSVKIRNIGDIDYLTFDADDELSQSDIYAISGLSFFYALFEIILINDGLCLKPVKKPNKNFVDESIGAILKYTGKTNELFTRMMINVAYTTQAGVNITADAGVAADADTGADTDLNAKTGVVADAVEDVNNGDDANISDNDNNRDDINTVKLLDPVAGKGTTLYEGLIKGFDVYGVEIGDKTVNEAYHYIKKFLEEARYKHEHASTKLSGPGKSYQALRHTFHIAKTKEAYKAKNTKTFEIIAGNSLYANKYYKKGFFDIIVGDLPYGVQHGNVTNQKQSSATRNPAELLDACLPSWLDVLKRRGCIVLAWNRNVLSREKMESIFTEHGLDVKIGYPYSQFGHRVDQAIYRDIIVAQKK